MTNFQWLAGGLMLLLVLMEITAQFAGWARRSVSTLRMIVWASAAFFIFYPQATVGIANALSIGRGADLLLYVTVIAFLISFFYVIHAIERHREQLTALVRQIAIMEPYAIAEQKSESSTAEQSNS